MKSAPVLDRLGTRVRIHGACVSGEARALRISRSASLELIAERTGVHRATVSRWERGERLPTGDRLEAYAKVLDELAALPELEAAQ
jgi:transcriptional regulator with XRE-family HTH domain